MRTSDFDFEFPKELIAHTPARKRDASHLLVLDKATGDIEHKKFSDISGYLKKGDLLVLNDTRVIKARLFGVKAAGTARIEVLLASRIKKNIWECLVKPGKRLKVGSKIIFGKGKMVGKVLEKLESGEQIIQFSNDRLISKLGEVPLPPYIKQSTERRAQSTGRYQTVYARKDGASAAPTAGLHFTPRLLKKIKAKGVKIAYVTLHTGLATFKPVHADNIKDHKMHEESFAVPSDTIKALKRAKRVVAVGTTVVRALESHAQGKKDGKTNLFIYPGYKFRVVDALITNFHFPRSTLIMMVSAFAGKQKIEKAYQEAFSKKYRLFSFGDAMFIK